MDVRGGARRPGFQGDSWGGWVVLSVGLSALLYSPVSMMFDGRVTVLTSTGRSVSETSGRFGSALAALTLAGAAVFAVLALSGHVRRARFGAQVTAPLLVLLAWGALTPWLRGDGIGAVLQAVLLLVTALAVVASPPTPATLSRLSILRDLLVVGSLAWSLLHPVTAQTACRPDKCGLFGTLWYGLFPTENSAGAAIALLLPTLVLAGRRRFSFSLAIALLFIAATGSRTAYVSAAVAVVYLVLARRFWVPRGRAPQPVQAAGGAGARDGMPNPTGAPGMLWRAVPLAGLLLSLAIFAVGSGTSLTGRGSVYVTLRESLDSWTALLIGSGPGVLSGLLNGFVDSAHGEAPNDLVLFGVPGLLLLVVALGQVLLVGRWSWPQVTALALLATAAARFPTEAGLMLGLRTPEALVLLLACGMFAAPHPSSGEDEDTPVHERHDTERDAGLAPAAAG